MKKKHVQRAEFKHRCSMYFLRVVGNRVKEMGSKIVKFHAMMHVFRDILNFGVFMKYDTGSNEEGHKPVKTAARLTQKNEETFDVQTATRLEKMHLLRLAKQEFEGNHV